MTSLLLADAGPPPQLVIGFLVCSAIGSLLFVGGLVWLGLWLAKRTRPQPRPRRRHRDEWDE